MLVQPARVEARNGTRITVRVSAWAGCARCASGQGCGFGLADPADAGGRRLTLPLPPGVQAQPGDEVAVALGEADLVRAAFIVYGIPGAGLIGGVLVATALGLAETAAAAAAATGLAVAIVVARGVADRARGRCEPRLLGSVGGEGGHA